MSRVEYQEHDRKRINERGNKRKRDSESEHARVPHATPWHRAVKRLSTD